MFLQFIALEFHLCHSFKLTKSDNAYLAFPDQFKVNQVLLFYLAIDCGNQPSSFLGSPGNLPFWKGKIVFVCVCGGVTLSLAWHMTHGWFNRNFPRNLGGESFAEAIWLHYINLFLFMDAFDQIIFSLPFVRVRSYNTVVRLVLHN